MIKTLTRNVSAASVLTDSDCSSHSTDYLRFAIHSSLFKVSLIS